VILEGTPADRHYNQSDTTQPRKEERQMPNYEVIIRVSTKRPLNELIPDPADRTTANILDVADDSSVEVREVN
jgi:hypothetical protein